MRSSATGSSTHRWYLFHLGTVWFAAAMRLLPRSLRFPATLRIARLLTPIISRTEACREQQKSRVDGPREIAVHLLLNAMTQRQVTFDPVITITGYEELRRSYAEGKGLLLLQPHAVLTILMYRVLCDDGFQPVAVAADEVMKIAGTPLRAESLQPSPTFLVKVRRRLLAGRFVSAMVDRGDHQEGRTLEFDTESGPIIVAPALMHLAARCGANVAFTEVHVDEHGLAATFVAPSADAARSGEAITNEFVQFVRAHISRIRASYSAPNPPIEAQSQSKSPQPIFGRLFGLTGNAKRLLAAASMLHVALAVSLFVAGRVQLAPRLIDRDGIVASFAFDSYGYQQRAAHLVDVLKNEGIRSWAADAETAHIKLISIQFALFGWATGYSALSAEPLNLFCYLATLVLIFITGGEVAGRRVGLIAAATVALWPTFLLHTTQLLKDPLFIAGGLAVVLMVVSWLTRRYRGGGAAIMSTLMVAATTLLLLIRVKFGIIVLMVVVFGFVLLSMRQWTERRLLSWNLLSPLLVLSVVAVAPLFLGTTEKFKQNPAPEAGQLKSARETRRQAPSVISYAGTVAPATKQPSQIKSLYAAVHWIRFEIATTRHLYNVSYPDSGSGIDRNVEFADYGDMIRYSPRAFEIAMWAPFPNSWTNAGKRVGTAGRVLSALETFVIYLCQLLTLAAVFGGRKRLAGWLLLLISLFGLTMLGLIVSNIGSLYRFRYLFWMLFIILGAKGLEVTSAWLKERWASQISEEPRIGPALGSNASAEGI